MKLTDRAKAQLTLYLAQSGRDLVPAVLWEVSPKAIAQGGGQWTLGFYERGRTQTQWLVRVDEFEFYLDPHDQGSLAHMILDYTNGFTFVPSP